MEDINGGIIITIVLGNAVRKILEAVAYRVSLGDLGGVSCAVIKLKGALTHTPLITHGICGNGQSHNNDKSYKSTTVHLFYINLKLSLFTTITHSTMSNPHNHHHKEAAERKKEQTNENNNKSKRKSVLHCQTDIIENILLFAFEKSNRELIETPSNTIMTS